MNWKIRSLNIQKRLSGSIWGGNLADASLVVSMIEEGMKIMKKYKNLIIIGNCELPR